MTRSGWRHVLGLLLVSLSCAAPSVLGQQPTVELHGFGDWAYGRTSNNTYLAGLPEGNYRQVDLALNVTASVSNRLRVVGQAEWLESEDGSRTLLDYAFAEWKFSDELLLRAGQVKQPFGISNEVSTVGTLRPFFRLPQAIYGPVGLIGLAYRGLGVTGSRELGREWSLSYDVYAGSTVIEDFEPPEDLLRGNAVAEASAIEIESTRDLYGGRVALDTPLSGLKVGLSGCQGKQIGLGRRWVLGVDAEYLTDAWSIRAEYGHESVIESEALDAFYLEVAYRVGRHWQVATQYGRLSEELSGVDVSRAPSLLDHRELAIGLNYWFSPEFVFKLAYHRVDGNRLASPEPQDLAETVAKGQLRTRTNLVQFGAQFSF
jgi:hypothetical protein